MGTKPEVVNGKISDTALGRLDGRTTMVIYIDFGGSGCGFGLHAGFSQEQVTLILDTVGVERWEELKGQYIRALSEGWGGCTLAIGNILKDQWVLPRESGLWLSGTLEEVMKKLSE